MNLERGWTDRYTGFFMSGHFVALKLAASAAESPDRIWSRRFQPPQVLPADRRICRGDCCLGLRCGGIGKDCPGSGERNDVRAAGGSEGE